VKASYPGKHRSAWSRLSGIIPSPAPNASVQSAIERAQTCPGEELAVPSQPITARLIFGSSSITTAAVSIANNTLGCVG
jgi:hypothetical protein